MQYAAYATADFIVDDSFVAWVKTGAHNDFWQEFLAQHPYKQPVLEQARSIVLAASQTPVHLPDEQQVGQMWGAIRQAMDTESAAPVRPLSSGRLRHWYWAVAASVLLVAGWWQWFSPSPVQSSVSHQQLVRQSETRLREVVNTTGKPMPLAMPDGTTVMLESGSRLSYPTTFDNVARREVFLTGEAFFDVVKNPGQPFVVRAKTLTATVLGTSFTVNARADQKRAFVVVRTGKVSVTPQPSADPAAPTKVSPLRPIVLTPNQQLTFDQSNNQLTPTLTGQPQPVMPEQQAVPLNFEEAPLPDVFATLEKRHNVDLVFDEIKLSDCRLSASFADEPLFVQLRLICRTMGATYQVVNNQIIIQANGCSQ